MPITNARECFDPGVIVITPTAMRRLTPSYALAALRRHLQGDWGVCSPEDREANQNALRTGCRLLSVYPLEHDPDNFWILTEADRSVTTILLPSDY